MFTAFSGSHQDAIKKCLDAQTGDSWQVAYLPIDPKDVGRSYEEVIRVNSQSGKAGAAYLVEQALGLQLPRWMQEDFSRIVQQASETQGQEIRSPELVALFKRSYWQRPGAYSLEDFHVSPVCEVSARLVGAVGSVSVTGQGSGVLAAFVDALGAHFDRHIEILAYQEQAMSEGSDAQAACYVRLACDGVVKLGMACHRDIISASLLAVLNGIA